MSWEISWADVCRTCMTVEGVLLPLYEDHNDLNDLDLAKMIAQITCVELNKDDGLPTKICAKCVYRTKTFFEFKNLVQDTDKKLKHMFNEQFVTDINDEGNDDLVNIECVAQNDEWNSHENEEDSSVNYKDNCNVSILQSMQEIENDLNLNDNCNAIILKVENVDNIVEINSNIQDFNISSQVEGYNNSIKTKEFEGLEKQRYYEQINNTNLKIKSEMMNKQNCQSNDINAETLLYKKETKDTNAKILLEKKEAKDTSVKSLLNTKELKKTTTLMSKNETKENVSNSDSLLDDADSDSDNSCEIQENIVGSINDTVTKIKEIKEGNKIIQYQCTLCSQNYKLLSQVLGHMVDLHVPISGPFYCVVCEMDCDSIKQLKAHVKTHDGPCPYTCFLCNKSYLMKRYLKRHMACHTDFPRYRCTKCGERFKVKSELENHAGTHNQGAAFACSQCPRIFNHKGNYKRHLISHLDPQGLHLPKYPCNLCNKRFLNNRTLVTHMRVHTGEKPYKCKDCGKAFSQQGNLLNHQKIHTNPRSFTCEICGKRFNQKATLRDHSLLHSGEKPYVCNVCGVAFTFSTALRRHMWTHSDGKPFECDMCNATFVGRYDLKRHIKVHSAQNKCKRNKSSKLKKDNQVVPEQIINIVEDPVSSDTIFVEQIFLCDDTIQIISQGDSEKENVDSILRLI